MNTQDGVAFDTIPESLKEIPQWLVWGDEKKPYSPRTGRLIDATLVSNGSRFDVAQKAYENGLYRGVGFIISPPFVAVDLDDCITYSPIDGRPYPDELADDIVMGLDSYTEISPSDTGLHILMRGDIPSNRQGNWRAQKVELYRGERYLTITGHVFGAYRDIQDDVDSELSRLYQRISKPTASKVLSAIPGMQPGNGRQRRSDEEVISAIEKWGNPRFKALWNGAWGDLYKSQSEADVALVRYLWHFSNEYEPAQVDRLFRRSRLYTVRPGKHTPKWDEHRESAGMSYGWWTIAKVVGVDNEDS